MKLLILGFSSQIIWEAHHLYQQPVMIPGLSKTASNFLSLNLYK